VDKEVGVNIYGTAWKNLEKKIAATRRQSISRADLVKWQLEALEEAVDSCGGHTGITHSIRPDADSRDE